jgi:hypothetical protein
MIVLLAALHLSLGAMWHSIAPGVWLREERIAESGPLVRVRAVVVRIDPAANRIRLDVARSHEGLQPEWVIDSMPGDAVVALNAGQFTGGFPWGWVIRNRQEFQLPGKGTLGMALVVDSAGEVALVTPDEIPSWRGRAVWAFQSYPAIIVDGRVPWELRAPGRGVDLSHHDSRLALCTLGDGSLVIVLTRLDVPGAVGSTLPWGPTVTEMAEYMLSLGCIRSMLLDGGISSQLAVRGNDGTVRRWPNWRRVPLAMIIEPRR